MNIPVRSKLAVFLFGLTLQNYSTMYPHPKKSTHKKLNKCHFATQHSFLLNFYILVFQHITKNMFYNIFLFVPQHPFFYEFWTVK